MKLSLLKKLFFPFIASYSHNIFLTFGMEFDGGRERLYGNRNAFGSPDSQSKGNIPKPKDCPKVEELSPFSGIAFANREIFVLLDLEDKGEPKCHRLIEVNGANSTALFDAAKLCGAVGEYKRRIAESLNIPMFTGGFSWVGEGEKVPVKTDMFEGEVTVTREKWEAAKDCWASGCGCEQTTSPKMRIFLYILAGLGVLGLIWDTMRYFKEKKEEEEEEEDKGKEKKEKKEKKDKKEKKEKKDKKEKKEKKEKKNKEKDGDESDGKSSSGGEKEVESATQEEDTKKDK